MKHRPWEPPSRRGSDIVVGNTNSNQNKQGAFSRPAVTKK